MKVFGHGGFLSKVGHEIENGIDKADEFMHKVFGDNAEIRVGFSSNDDGKTITPSASLNYNNQNGTVRQTSSKPAGYSRTTAATAKDIAQGGMTKDEVIEFNMKHPNETAQGVNK